MWSWYEEWSTVARQAIHDRRLLRAMGFLLASGAPVPDDSPTEEDASDDEAELDDVEVDAAE